MHILTNISRRKDNETKKFCQLIEYNMRNIFLEKSYTKCWGETIPRPFIKNWNWPYPWINSLTFYTVCFYYMSSWRISKYIETKQQTTCFYLICFFKKKTERGLKLVLFPHFLHDLWRERFPLLNSINWPNFITWLALLREILGNMCFTIVC